QCQLQFWIHAPLVLSVKTETVESHRFCQVLRESLTPLIDKPVNKVGGREDPEPRNRADAESCVSNVIAPEVTAELQSMTTLGEGDIIHKLILGNLATLREDIALTVDKFRPAFAIWVTKWRVEIIQRVWERSIRRSGIRLAEDRAVPTD